ncbi:hypothetical protein ACHQM5_030663 [Ranunculus cassubicifolius]
MMRHGHGPSPDHMENKIAAQVAEIGRLTRENQRLASTHVAMRQDLVATKQEAEKVHTHIRSIQTESDIQIRMLLEKIKKMDSNIRVSDNLKMDLQQAHKEAQSLVLAREELAYKIQQSTQELKKAHAELEQLPELQAELNKLRQEHQRLREAFEYEKGLNTEKVDKLHAREKHLISMAREVEKLRTEVSIAETRSHAPYSYGTTYSNQDTSSYPHPFPGGSGGYARPHIQMSGNGAVVSGGDAQGGG